MSLDVKGCGKLIGISIKNEQDVCEGFYISENNDKIHCGEKGWFCSECPKQEKKK